MLREGKDVTIVGTGLMVGESLKAAELLANEGISARVIDMHTIKPLDGDILLKAAQETGALVTAEEHSVIGGLGGAVSEYLCERSPVPVLRVGVNDQFGRSGPAVEVLERYGLTAENIVAKAKAAISMKKEQIVLSIRTASDDKIRGGSFVSGIPEQTAGFQDVRRALQQSREPMLSLQSNLR